MISRWKWMLKQTIKKLWFRATLFAIVAIITALLSILFKSMIPESVSVKVGAEAVDNILNILASSMLAVTTFSLSIMVTAYGSATTNVTPRATRLVVEDVTTQNVLATFIGSFLLKWSTKTGHRFRVFPVSVFRFIWWQPTVIFVRPERVVIPNDIVRYFMGSIAEVHVTRHRYPLVFQTPEEALHRAVIPAISSSTQTLFDLVTPQ